MGVYILKKFDEELLKFTLTKNRFGDYACEIVQSNGKTSDFPEKLTLNSESVLKWLKSRIIPRNREFVHEILGNQGLSYDDLEGILNVCMGLSVNDVYWVVPEGFQGKFKSYNLYENSFSNALSLVAFTGHSQTIQDLSPSPEMTTNGQLPKAWRRFGDTLYLYKGGTDLIFSNGGNEPYSEYYASQVAEAMEISYVPYELEQWKGILACVCENFTNLNQSYVPIGRLMGKSYSLEKLNALIENLNIKQEFSNMILFDAVILNEDRHLGNFGLLKNNYTNAYESMAPLFDHGISLLSHFSEKDLLDECSYREFVEKHNYSALGAKHDALVRIFCNKSDIKKLTSLYNFRFKKHTKYNVSEQRLKRMETLVQQRARELTNVLLKVQEEPVLNDVGVEKQGVISNSFLNFQYEYIGDDWSGDYIISKNNKIVCEGKIQPQDVRDVDPITYIESKIEKLFQEQVRDER